jgi:hypothetical protein
LTLGRTTYPFAVGYESQIIEVINQKGRSVNELVVLYPKSTVWAEHEFISLNSKADKLMATLGSDEELAKIAWEKYGLRKIGYNIDNERYKEYGIPKEVRSFLPLPKVQVMEEILTII